MPADEWLKANRASATQIHLRDDMYCRELKLNERNEVQKAAEGTGYDMSLAMVRYALVNRDGSSYFTSDQLAELENEASAERVADLASELNQALASKRLESLDDLKKKSKRTVAAGS